MIDLYTWPTPNGQILPREPGGASEDITPKHFPAMTDEERESMVGKTQFAAR